MINVAQLNVVRSWSLPVNYKCTRLQTATAKYMKGA